MAKKEPAIAADAVIPIELVERRICLTKKRP
jgi:hypothetical protein